MKSVAIFVVGCFGILALLVNQTNGYWARALSGIKCIDNYPPGKSTCDDDNCAFEKPGHVFNLACDLDCKAQHGAAGGYCLATNICNCRPPVFIKREYPPLQCLDIKQAKLYQTICEEDCKCTHNKIGGGCNFWTKMCECGPTNTKPELDCPHETGTSYFVTLLSRYKTLGIDIAGSLVS